MNRAELVKLTKETFELKSLELAGEKLKAFESALTDVIKDGGDYKLAGVVVEAVDKEATSGVTKLTGEEKSWNKPAHKSVKASVSKSLKDEVYQEI